MKAFIALALKGLAAALAGLALTGCDAVSTARVFDPVVRAMADEADIARFEAVVATLQSDDAAALSAMFASRPQPGFAEEVTDYFPNETPKARYFSSLSNSVSLSGANRTRALTLQAVYCFEDADYFVTTQFSSSGDGPLQLVALNIIPVAGPAAARREPAAPDAPQYDPV